MAASTPAWSPDGQAVALLGTAKKGYWYEDLQDIWIVDAAKGTERTVKMQISATDWLHSLPVFWSGDGQQFLLRLSRARRSQPVVGARRRAAWRRASPTSAGRCARSTTTAKGDAFVYVRSGPVDRSGGVLPAVLGRRRRASSRGLPTNGRAFASRRKSSYRSFDGLYIQGFLYLPPEHARQAPAIRRSCKVHGGGTNSYLRTQNLLEQYLASKGYVVLAINYRGGSGFGREFQDLGVNDWASGQAHDAAIAADFMRSLPYVNGKVGIYGYSYGGIMTMATIARYPDKYDAAVPMAGIYDFGDALTNADRLGKIFTQTGHGGPPARAQGGLRAQQHARAGARTSRRRSSSCTARRTSARPSASTSWRSRS